MPGGVCEQLNPNGAYPAKSTDGKSIAFPSEIPDPATGGLTASPSSMPAIHQAASQYSRIIGVVYTTGDFKQNHNWLPIGISAAALP